MNQHGLDEMNLLSILLITIIIIIFLAWMVKYKANAKERLLVIEKDYDLSKFTEKKKNASFPWIKIGIVIFAGCLGYLIGGIIESFFPNVTSIRDRMTIFNSNGTMSLLFMYMFAGIGMLFNNKIAKDKQ